MTKTKSSGVCPASTPTASGREVIDATHYEVSPEASISALHESVGLGCFAKSQGRTMAAPASGG